MERPELMEQIQKDGYIFWRTVADLRDYALDLEAQLEAAEQRVEELVEATEAFYSADMLMKDSTGYEEKLEACGKFRIAIVRLRAALTKMKGE